MAIILTRAKLLCVITKMGNVDTVLLDALNIIWVMGFIKLSAIQKILTLIMETVDVLRAVVLIMMLLLLVTFKLELRIIAAWNV